VQRDDAITRLRGRVPAGTIVYVVMRDRDPDNDWMICDLYLIDGHRVTCVTDDVARVLGCFDPRFDPGIRLARAPGGDDPLRQLIDRSLSRLLFNAPGQVSHQVIG
jgi:hypothetical protein